MLADAIDNFCNNLSALREFNTLVASLLDSHTKQSAKQRRQDLIPLALVAGMLGKDSGEALSDDKIAALKKEFGCDVILKPAEDGAGVQIGFAEIDGARRFTAAIEMFMKGDEHRSKLYRSSLVSLVSAAEWFLSQVIRAYFTVHPDAAGVKEKTLTVKDLRNFASINDAEQHLMQLRIDEIMWGGLEDWLKFFRESVKLSMGYIKTHELALIEVFQRRNVIVHNNGVVHPTYIAKVAQAMRQGLEVGQVLDVAPDYQERAIDVVEVTFLLIASELWKQLDAKDEERSNVLTRQVIDHLKDKRWIVAEGLSFFSMNDKQLPERSVLVGRMNYWQTLKWEGRYDEVKKEIEDADFSAKDELFQAARHVLLDDFPATLELLPRAIDAQKLRIDDVKEWPIFRELRKTELCRRFIEIHEGKQEQNKIAESTPQIQHPAIEAAGSN